MSTETAKTTIAAALVKAQKAFGPALKDKANPAFRSKYADLGACLDAVMDALNAAGIFLTQKTHEASDGVMVETVFVHESGEERSSGLLHVPATKKDAQGYGSALTYARRYSLMAACGIAPEDDDGNAASKKPQQAQPGVRGVANAVLATSEAIPAERMAELDDLAVKVVGAFGKKGAEWCSDRLDEEELDDTELIYLTTKLPSDVRNKIKAAKAAKREAAEA